MTSKFADFTFKNHQLSDAERLWLREAASPDFSPRAAKVKLHAQLPSGFYPEQIDPRIIASNRITPIGLWHLDPHHPMLDAMDRTIAYIRTRILENPDIATVTAPEIAQATALTEQAAGAALYALGEIGEFWSTAQGSGARGGKSYDRIELSGDNSFDRYLHYAGMDDLLERFYTRRGKALWGAIEYGNQGEQESKRLVSPDTHTTNEQQLKAFLCHGSEDKPRVRDLHKRLLQDGITPWLDEHDLLPGVEWATAIRAAVRNSDVVIVCLSRRSTTKLGFVQKEIRIALDAAEERPEGVTYIIPAKLEDCALPGRIQKWQAVNLYDADGYMKLLKALHQYAIDRHFAR